MNENRFSLNKQLRNSKLSSSSHNSSGSNSVRSFNSSNKANTQCHRTRKLKYFEIYNQVKEEMKKNNVDKKKPNTQYNPKRQELLDNLYIKNTAQLNNYYEKNYPNIEIQGTKDLEGIYKKDLSSEMKSNQNNFIENMPLKYRNPQLNINCEKLNLTPIPYIPNKDSMNDLEKEEYDKAKQKSVFIRKVEYTHAKPPPKNNIGINFSQNNQKFIGYKINNIVKAAKLIQKWFRFLKKIRSNTNKYKQGNKKFENNKKKNKVPIDYEKESLIENENNINILDNEYNNNKYENKQIKLNNINNQNKNNLSLEEGKFINNINIESNFNFQIKKIKTSDEPNIKLKPINNNCYITRGEIVLLNNSPDMYDLNLIQKKVKKFLKNKNKISPYKIFKQLQQKEKEKENHKKSDITNESNHSSEHNFSDFMNNSEKIYEKKRIISKLDSLQSIHNMSIQEKEKTISDKFFKKQFNNDNESDSSLNDENIFKNKNINNIDPELNLMNFSFNSEKNKNDINDEAKIFQIKKNSNKNFYISKNVYCNNSDVIMKLTNLQMNIKNFLNKNNNRNIYTENSSDTNLNNESKNTIKNSFVIENNNFQMHPYKKSAKTKILEVLLNKYNKKLNKEVNQNINLYHDKNNEKNKIFKIFKTKLAYALIKILQNHLKQIFNDIYQYETIYYKRKKILLKIINNINTRLRKYLVMVRWSRRPIKLLIYKSKSVKYYNSLFILNNNIKKLINTLYNVFAGKSFYILIINYLYENDIDIMNNKIFLLLNNKRKLKIFYEISKNINQKKNKEENFDNINLVEYFKSIQNMNNNKLNSINKIQEEEEKEEEREEEKEEPEEKEEKEEREEKEKENDEQEQDEKEENGEENFEQEEKEENGEENEEQEPEENYEAEGEEKEENEESKEIDEIEEAENEESIDK